MGDRKIITIADVIASEKIQDFEVTYKGAVLRFRYHPLTYGSLKMMLRAKAAQGKDAYDRGDALLLHCIKKLESDSTGKLVEKDISTNELNNMPSGLVGDLHSKFGDLSGMGVSEADLKKLLESMTS